MEDGQIFYNILGDRSLKEDLSGLKKSWNSRASKMIRIEVILPGALDSEHTSYLLLILLILMVNAVCVREVLQARSPKMWCVSFLNTNFLVNMLILHKRLHESVNTQIPFITCFLKHVKVLKKKRADRVPCQNSPFNYWRPNVMPF